MSVLTKLEPTTQGSLANWDGGADSVLNDNSDSTFADHGNNATETVDHAWNFPDVDADFSFMKDDLLFFTIRYGRNLNTANKVWDSLQVRIMSGSTVLAAANSGGAFVTVASNITTTSVLEANAVFSYVNESGTETQWNAATIELRTAQTITSGGNSDEFRVYEVDIDGTYVKEGSVVDRGTLILRGGDYTSGNWLDQSGWDNDAVLVGSPTFTTDHFALNGSSQYFTIASPSHMNVSSSQGLTILVKFAATDWNNGTNEWLIYNFGTAGYFIAHADGVSAMRMTVDDGPDSRLDDGTGYQSFTDAEPFVFGGRLDRGTDEVEVFEDGSWTDSATDASAVGAIPAASTIFVGSQASGNDSATGDFYDIVVWQEALSDADMAIAFEELKVPEDLTGVADADVAVTGSATGRKTESGAVDVVVAASATGRKTESGASDIAVAASATGVRVGVGEANADVVVAASATGLHTGIGQANFDIVLTQVATGRKTESGAADVAVTASATGGVERIGEGAATVVVSLSATARKIEAGAIAAIITASATGRKTEGGASAVAVTTSATGLPEHLAEAAADVVVSASATGRKIASGASSVVVAGSATGVTDRFGAAAIAAVITASATGKNSAFGEGAADVVITGAGTGELERTAVGAATVTVGGVATGDNQTKRGAGATAVQVLTSATGTLITIRVVRGFRVPSTGSPKSFGRGGTKFERDGRIYLG